MLISKRDAEAYKIEAAWVVSKFIDAINDGENVIALVHTLRQRRKREDGTWQAIDDSEVSKLALAVTKDFNRQVYGAAYRRYKKMVPMLWGHEGRQKYKKHHLNLALAVPRWLPVQQAMGVLESCFDSKSWSAGRRRTQKIAWDPLNWSRYSVKEHGSIILAACHLSPN